MAKIIKTAELGSRGSLQCSANVIHTDGMRSMSPFSNNTPQGKGHDQEDDLGGNLGSGVRRPHHCFRADSGDGFCALTPHYQ